MNSRPVRAAVALLGSVAISGCALLPQSGPDDRAIANRAVASLENSEQTLGYEYVVVDLRRDLLPFIPAMSTQSLSSFGAGSGAPEIRLGVGDVVQVTVFESQTGGLFVPEQAGARPGNFVTLPPQEIGRNGEITVPYAGAIRAAGNTPSAVEGIIERRLQDRAIEPEVSIGIVEQNFARVTLLGQIGSPGSFTLRNSGDRVLDVIAQAGGIRAPDHTTFVTVTRGGRSLKVPYDVLISTPRENIFLAPGDSVNVTAEPQQFHAFGATGAVGTFDFSESGLSLNTALAQIRGLVDTRADPRDVFVYRTEPVSSLQQMGLPIVAEQHPHGHLPTIYRVDFRKPDSFFLAQDFRMRDDDVIYVSNAESVDLSKFFGVLNTTAGGTATLDANIDRISSN